MEKSNMDAFNEYAAKILSSLYDEFPKDSHIDIRDYISKIDDQEQKQIFIGTMQFLKDEGYITHGSVTMGLITFTMVRLTSLGLSVLGGTPASLKEAEPFIDRIKKALASGGKEAIKSAIQGAISYSITAISG